MHTGIKLKSLNTLPLRDCWNKANDTQLPEFTMIYEWNNNVVCTANLAE